MSRTARFWFWAAALAVNPCVADAQMQMQMSPGWQWQVTGNVFAGGNYQYRKFKDFHTIESQNWVMGAGQRPWAGGNLQFTSMLSFEPFTFKKIGSPQAFQTGETFEGVPLVDYQHPHDLFTNLGAWYSRDVGGYQLLLNAAPVGSPALGPQPFMHRPSAAENPQAPLSHHNLDSTHITPGVLTAGLSREGFGLESSWFRGREPDERRTDLDLGALDSWSIRGSWKRSGWTAQVSGGHITNPEVTEPGRDKIRLTASAGYHHIGDIDTALFAAWGQNREAHGHLNAFLFESNIAWLDRNYLYSRAEVAMKDILNAGGYDPAGFLEPHVFSRVGAFTLGYTHDINHGTRARVGIGGDVTMYDVPTNLKENYGGPVSLHLFVRVRFPSADPMAGMQH
jgi:hypothetical protein